MYSCDVTISETTTERNYGIMSIIFGEWELLISSLIRPIVTYGYDVWTSINRGEQYLRIPERRKLRKIFGPVQIEDGFWRIRMKHELNDLIKTQI
jgi:hypothetical protein